MRRQNFSQGSILPSIILNKGCGSIFFAAINSLNFSLSLNFNLAFKCSISKANWPVVTVSVIDLKFSADLIFIETIISLFRFLIYFPQVLINTIYCFFGFPEAGKLRMIFVSLCFVFQNIFCKQSLPPKSYKAFAVEIFWMNGPDAHDNKFITVTIKRLVSYHLDTK